MSHDGLPLILVDTAGLRATDDAVEKLGIARSAQEIADADLILWLGPSDSPVGESTILLSPKADINPPCPGRLPVSATTGEGIGNLWATISARLSDRIPVSDQLALTQREGDLLHQIVANLRAAAHGPDPLLATEDLRGARFSFDRLTGRAGVEELLDSLFRRFCVGK